VDPSHVLKEYCGLLGIKNIALTRSSCWQLNLYNLLCRVSDLRDSSANMLSRSMLKRC